MKAILMTALLAMGTVAMAHDHEHGGWERGSIEINMQSRHYNPGEGFNVSFDGPLKVTGVRILTRGERGATLSCEANGVSCGSDTYRGHWEYEWMTFAVSNPRVASSMNFVFGRRDPVIERMIVDYAVRPNVVIKEVIRTVKVFVPKSQLGEKILDIKARMYSVASQLGGSPALAGLLDRGYMLLNRANMRAQTHSASDPDRRVGQAVDTFLENYACAEFMDVYGTLAQHHQFTNNSLSTEIEELGIAIFQMADMRRYEPAACAPEMAAWLKAHPSLGLKSLR